MPGNYPVMTMNYLAGDAQLVEVLLQVARVHPQPRAVVERLRLTPPQELAQPLKLRPEARPEVREGRKRIGIIGKLLVVTR